MKSPYKVLHDKAMEFVDEAQFAKMEGNEIAARRFFEEAFSLEKEAALSAPMEKEDNFARSLYLRSAAYLAFDLGYLFDAFYLVTLGLSNQAPIFVVKQLEALKEKLVPLAIGMDKTSFHLMGLFTKADANTCSITVEDENSKQIYFIQVPIERIQEIVRKYWFSKVAIEAKVNNNGLVILENISAAA